MGLWSFKVMNASFFANFSMRSSDLSHWAILADCESYSSTTLSLDFL